MRFSVLRSLLLTTAIVILLLFIVEDFLGLASTFKDAVELKTNFMVATSIVEKRVTESSLNIRA